MKQWLVLSVVLLFTFILYFFSYSQVVQNYFRVPDGYSYLGFTEYPTDVIENLGIMQQGYAGHWFRRSHYSSAIPSKPFLLKFEYLLFGNIGKVLGIEAPNMLQTVILGLSILVLISLWFLISRIYQRYLFRLLAWVFTLFATGIAGHEIGWGKLQNDLQVFQRLTFTMPHYLLGSFFCIMTLLFLSKSLNVEKGEQKSFVLAIFFGMAMTQVFVPNTLIVLGSLLIFVCIYFLHTKSPILRKRVFIHIVVYGIGISLPVVYLFYASSAFGWETYRNAETIMPIKLQVTDYFDLIGVTFIYFVLALPTLFKSKNMLTLLLLSWCLFHPFSAFLLPAVVGVNQIRFFQGPYFYFIAILSITSAKNMYLFFEKRNRRFSMIALLLYLILSFIPSLDAYKLSYNTPKMCFCQVTDLQFGYPRLDDRFAFTWLNTQGTTGEIVLAEAYIGGLIPAMTTKRTYLSWWLYLFNQNLYNELYQPVKVFFSGAMSQDEAKNFIKSQNIAYVYYGNTERWNNWELKNLPYDFLQKKLQYQDVIIYKTVLQE